MYVVHTNFFGRLEPNVAVVQQRIVSSIACNMYILYMYMIKADVCNTLLTQVYNLGMLGGSWAEDGRVSGDDVENVMQWCKIDTNFRAA